MFSKKISYGSCDMQFDFKDTGLFDEARNQKPDSCARRPRELADLELL